MEASKRLRTPNNSPDKPTDKSVKLDTCAKCNETVSDDCIACYWCAQWEHRTCANIKEDELVILNSNSENILFFCSQCLPNLPNALSPFKFHSQLNEKFESKLKSFEDLTVQIGKSLEDFASKIDHLLSSQSGLQMEVDSVSQSLQNPTAPVGTSGSVPNHTSASSAAQNIVDELADRDRRKKNIIVYNLPEAKDREADKGSILSLCKTAFDFDIPITKIIRLGKKVDNRHRPLLVGFEHEDDKVIILSRAYLLHRHDQYKRVFIAPDRTKFEREKHRKLVNELRQRQSQGETGLIIRNGNIITRSSRTEDSSLSKGTSHRSQSS